MLKKFCILGYFFSAAAIAGNDSLPLPEEVLVDGGKFYAGTIFGDVDYKNNNNVYRDSYLIMNTEVTFKLYKALQPWGLKHGYALGDACNGATLSGCRGESDPEDMYPAVNITWWDTILFANALSEHEGLTPYYITLDGYPLRTIPGSRDTADIKMNPQASGYHLPGFVEWHVAARGGLKGLADGSYGFPYSGSENASEVANFPTDKGSADKTLPVASKKPNALGLYDMSGNAAEWLEESNHYAHDPSMTMYYFCGGSFEQNVKNLASCDLHSPGFALPDLGFRLMRKPDE